MRYRVALSPDYCRYSSLENESFLCKPPSGVSADHVGKFPYGISHLMIELSERLSQEVRCNVLDTLLHIFETLDVIFIVAMFVTGRHGSREGIVRQSGLL